MGFCTNCGTQLPDKAAFCQECGHRVNISACPFCGKEVDGTAGFCIHCGKPLHESQNAKPVQDFSSSGKETAPMPEPPQFEDHGLQWSWTYKRMHGWISRRRFTETVIASLGDKALHITEKVEYGGKTTVNEKQVQLQNMVETSLKAEASVFLWLAFSFVLLLMLSLPILYFMGAIPSQGSLGTIVLIQVSFAVCILLGIRRYFFQIYHNELWIIETNGSKTVLQGCKRELLEEIESRIVLYAESGTNRITRTQSGAAGRIVFYVIAAALVVAIFLLLLCSPDSSNEGKSAVMANSAEDQEKNTVDVSESPRKGPSKFSANPETQDDTPEFKIDISELPAISENTDQEKDTAAAPEGPLQTDTTSEYAAIYADLVRQIAVEDDNDRARFSLIDFNGDDIPELVTFNSSLSLYTYDRNNLFTIIENWTSGWIVHGEMEYLPGKT